MKLVHLSVASIIGCLLGLLILVGIILNSVHEVGVRQEQVADLLALQARINDFSVASDSLLLFGADADLLAAYRREGQDLQQRLRQLDAESPDVRRAAHRIETLLDAVSGELDAVSTRTPPPWPSATAPSNCPLAAVSS